MRLFLLSLFLLTFTATSIVVAAPAKVQVFDGSMNLVFDATVKAVKKNWKKVRSSDRGAGTIRFHAGISLKTWGEDCTAALRELGNGKVEVSLQVKNSAQLYAWGVGDQIAQKLFRSIQDELTTSPPGSQGSPPTSSVQE
jgi:hypothetical protein